MTYAKADLRIVTNPKHRRYGKQLLAVDYGIKGYGFGQFYLYTDGDELYVDDECSGRKIIAHVMSRLLLKDAIFESEQDED